MGNSKSGGEMKLYNKDFINKESSKKTGKARGIPRDVSPQCWHSEEWKKICSKNNNEILKELPNNMFKIVSWNLNMNAHSAYAPEGWANTNDKWQLVFKQVMDQNPDIISYQEIPQSYFAEKTEKDEEYLGLFVFF